MQVTEPRTVLSTTVTLGETLRSIGLSDGSSTTVASGAVPAVRPTLLTLTVPKIVLLHEENASVCTVSVASSTPSAGLVVSVDENDEAVHEMLPEDVENVAVGEDRVAEMTSPTATSLPPADSSAPPAALAGPAATAVNRARAVAPAPR